MLAKAEKAKLRLLEKKLKNADLESEQRSSPNFQVSAESSKIASYSTKDDKRLKGLSILSPDMEDVELLEMVRTQMPPPASPSSLESFGGGSESCPSN